MLLQEKTAAVVVSVKFAFLLLFCTLHASHAGETLSVADSGTSSIEPKLTLLNVKGPTKAFASPKRGRCGSGPPSVMMMSSTPSTMASGKNEDAQARNVQRFLTTTRRLLQHFPWIAKIDVGLSSVQRRICAAALIGPNTAVTAARCFYGGPDGVPSNPR